MRLNKYIHEDNYKLSRTELEKKEISTLEKQLEACNDIYNKRLESSTGIDNKASLLLVVYVGLFTLLSLLLTKENFVLEWHKVLYCVLLCSTLFVYALAILILILTIGNRILKIDNPKSLSVGQNYKDWLISQIISKSNQCLFNAKLLIRKFFMYKLGSILLVISVFITFIFLMFTILVF